jgi:acyl-coenzyme A synthetase/AMP-(fatty) acid ligase
VDLSVPADAGETPDGWQTIPVRESTSLLLVEAADRHDGHSPQALAAVCGTRAPLGRPIDNVVVRLLDDRGQHVTLGIVGELHLGGACLARGHAGRPDLTEERFIIRKHADGRRERLYRTGDLGWWNEEGQLEYLGRVDGQVKVRGQRVELGEVEAVQLRHPRVRAAVVVHRTQPPFAGGLVAYVVLAEGELAVDELAMRTFLSADLPEAMVPSRVVALWALPTTAHGKVDRAALPAPGRRTTQAR